MVIGSYKKLEIGARYTGLKDKDTNPNPDQPYVILRETTWEEWFEGLEDGKSLRALKADPKLLELSKGHNYYLISVD
jgi:hypothetical protein